MPGYIFFTNPVPNITSTVLPTIFPQYRLQSVFSDNSLVAYKINNQSGGSVGTVKNSRAIARRT
jgi:hypothetical protein